MELPQDFVSEIAKNFPQDFLTREPGDLSAYGRDWTKVYAANPRAVVLPRTTEEVSLFLKLCLRHRIAIVPSGGRTGLAGGAVAPNGEIVLSLARMNRMEAVDPLAQTLRVQAGAVTQAVHEHCAPFGLTWPVDFASKGSSHVGGNIATNAGGVKVIHYGMTRQWVLGLQVVTMDGEIHELNGALEKNNTGVDLRQLFIGSEGILGVITEATLKLTRLPGQLDVFFFALDDMKAVLKLFLEARRAPFPLMAFETLTHNCLEATVRHLKLKRPFESESGAYVLMEVQRPVTPDAQAVLDQWLSGVFEKGLVRDGTIAQSPREARELWMIREGVAESIMEGNFVHKNDIALPIASLEAFVSEMYGIFAGRHGGMEIYLFGHIGDGNLHVNTMKPASMDRPDFIEKCHAADQDLFALVSKYRGSISAEHGIGLLKKEALGYSRSPAEIALMRAIKGILDPQGLMNPGKVL
ncbi:MAG: FAD-binding oxidoreductase [Oligoflexia bacterium]|nr:FAD-binding oxidoreductase [Oligoflexia bacterium]